MTVNAGGCLRRRGATFRGPLVFAVVPVPSMDRVLIRLLLVLCATHPMNAQDFVQRHDHLGPVYPRPPLVEPLPNGDLWLVWSSNTATSPDTCRVHVRKLGPAGQLLLENDLMLPPAYGGGGLTGAFALAGGGLVLVGQNASLPMIMRLDPTGQLLGAVRYSFGASAQFRDVVERPDGSLTVAGQAMIANEPVPWLLHTDSGGNQLMTWSDRIPGHAGINTALLPCDDGGVLVLGLDWDGLGTVDMHVQKLGPLDEWDWGRSISAGRIRAVQAVPRPGGGWIVLAEQQIQPGPQAGAPVLVDLGPQGQVYRNKRLWALPSDSAAYNASTMGQLPDGSLVVCTTVDWSGANAVFRLDDALVPEATALFIPGSTLAYGLRALAFSDGDLLLTGLAPDPFFITPLVARWDTAQPPPCGAAQAQVVADSIALGLDSTFIRVAINPTTEDITAMILPDTLSWTVTDPCTIGTGVVDRPNAATALHVYPDPAADVVHVTGTEGLSALVLLDARGRELRRWSVPLPARFDVTGDPPGLYLLVGAGAEGRRSARLVVQH